MNEQTTQESVMKETYRYIEENLDRYVAELCPLIQHKSVSMTHTGITECAEYLQSLMEQSGIPAKLYPTAGGHPVVIGQLKADREDAPTLLVYGHYDVMPEGPLNLWESDPYDPVVRDGRLWGRGTGDNKGQLFAHIKAQEAYRKHHDSLPINITYLFDGEEEIGSPSLKAFCEEHQDLLKADLAVCSDAGIHASGRPTIQLGVKGLCAVKLTCRTIKKPQHSQYAPAAPSASWRLVDALSTMKKAEGAVLVDGFYDHVIDPSPEDIAALEKLPYDHAQQLEAWGVTRLLENRKTNSYLYNYMFEPTCNIGCLSAGDVAGSKNVTVDEAVAYIDYRLVPGQEPEDILALTREHLARRGFGDIQVDMYAHLPCSKTPLTSPYVPMMEQVLRDSWDAEPVVFPMIGGGAPFYLFSDLLKTPWMLVPIATADQNDHGANENLDLSCFIKGIKTGAALIDNMGKMNR